MDCVTVFLLQTCCSCSKTLTNLDKIKMYLHAVLNFIFFISQSTDPLLYQNTEDLLLPPEEDDFYDYSTDLALTTNLNYQTRNSLMHQTQQV